MKDFIDETIEKEGTPINRKNLMALQGFDNKKIKIENGKIIETNGDGHTLTIELEEGKVVETFVGEKTIKKTIKRNNDGSITEELS